MPHIPPRNGKNVQSRRNIANTVTNEGGYVKSTYQTIEFGAESILFTTLSALNSTLFRF